MKAKKCVHLKVVDCPNFPEAIFLLDQVLNNFGACAELKLFTENTIRKCREKKSEAILESSQPVVTWKDSRYIHLSVFDGTIKTLPCQLRCIVKYDTTKDR